MTHELDRAVSQVFLSCDLTGSTNFKQRAQEKGDSGGWQKVFLQFYREFPQQLATTKRELGNLDLDFRLWKPVGDEIIYSCEVGSEDEVYRAVRTWISAMRSYNEKSLDDTTMGTKGGGFIATFPSPDSKSSVPRRPDLEVSDRDVRQLNRDAYDPMRHDDYLYDYFGPSIDTGFRVFAKCDARYFTVSVEVAMAMIHRSNIPGSTQADFHVDDFVLLDFVELKGVWSGRRYPVVAIDLEHGDDVNRAFSKFEKPNDPADILALCMACYNSSDPKWPFQLYLPQSQDDRFQEEPMVPPEPPTQSQVGAETEADDPTDPKELSADPPLGETKYNTGFQQLKLDAGTSDREAELALTRAIAAGLPPGEFIVRVVLRDSVPTPEPGKRIFAAEWTSTKNVRPQFPDELD